jgi:hypothetical protein
MSLSSGGNLTVSGDVTVNGGDITVAGATPKITIGDAGTEDTMLVFDGNAADYRIGLDDGTDKLEIGAGSAHGTTAAIIIDSSGNVEKIGQSTHADGYFLKYNTSTNLAEWAAATVSSIAADDISAGDAAVTITTTTGNITIDAAASNSDIIFKGTDGGSDITMLTLDGSQDGAAKFKSVIAPGVEVVGANTNVTVSMGYTFITSGSDATATTCTLPTTATAGWPVGTTFTIKKVDAGTDQINITRGGSDTIDGGTTVSLYYQNESISVVYGAANTYYIV